LRKFDFLASKLSKFLSAALRKEGTLILKVRAKVPMEIYMTKICKLYNNFL